MFHHLERSTVRRWMMLAILGVGLGLSLTGGRGTIVVVRLHRTSNRAQTLGPHRSALASLRAFAGHGSPQHILIKRNRFRRTGRRVCHAEQLTLS